MEIYLIAILLAVLNAFFVFLVVLGLPGIWLMVTATALVAWWQWDHNMFSIAVLVTIAVLALASEWLEFVAGMSGSRRAGGTSKGAWGALLGGFVGALVGSVLIPIPILGTLIGACAGAGGGAWALERAGGTSHDLAVRSGKGAAVGRLLGTMIKLGFAVAIWLIVTVASFWP